MFGRDISGEILVESQNCCKVGSIAAQVRLLRSCRRMFAERSVRSICGSRLSGSVALPDQSAELGYVVLAWKLFPLLRRCQRIEVLRSGERAPVVASDLPLAECVHDLDAGDDDASAMERLKAQHRSDDALDRPVVLLDDVVEVLALPNRDRRVMLGVVAFDAGGVGAALVNRDALRKAVVPDGPGEKPLRRRPITFGGEHEVHGVTGLVHRAIEVLPVPTDLDVGLVHAPTRSNGALPSTKGLFHDRHQLDDPTMNRGVIDAYATLLHHLFEVAQAQGIGHVPPHAHQHDLQGKPQPLDHALHRTHYPCHIRFTPAGNPVTRQNLSMASVRLIVGWAK